MKKLAARLIVCVGLLVGTLTLATSPASADHFPFGRDGYCRATHPGFPEVLNDALVTTKAKVKRYKDGTVTLRCTFIGVPRDVGEPDNFPPLTRAKRSPASLSLCGIDETNQNPYTPAAYVETLYTPGGVWHLTCTIPPGDPLDF